MSLRGKYLLLVGGNLLLRVVLLLQKSQIQDLYFSALNWSPDLVLKFLDALSTILLFKTTSSFPPT